ncbi:hypothetical protein ACIGFK_13020 [Streptomyces sp. NPDC085524]|uniref:hypothetical protein n=1 Tax=Streptomyces sp. NPDC085524 TaxID=3365728 RepID=UPI0037D0CC73
MSDIMPDPWFDTPDEFDLLMTEVPVLTPFATMFAEAEEILAESCLEGFTPENAGRMALDMLPEDEREAALDQLLYTWWSARENDREALARHQAGGAR